MILVTGVNGQLGFDVVKELNKRNIENIGIDRQELDITDSNAVNRYITNLKPECVIHCAGYTAVDKAEENSEECIKVNVNGTENIAKACQQIDAKMVLMSTDYVFDGTGIGEYEANDKVNPMSNYGKSKACAENIVMELLDKYFIIRTSWLFGVNGSNFIKTIIKLSKTKKQIDVVDDQVGSPTYTLDLAYAICDVILTDKYGIYHITNDGFCSWAELAEEVIKLNNAKCTINHVSTKEYNSVAVRPLNSKLSKRKLIENGFKKLPFWKDAVERFFEANTKEDKNEFN